MSLNMTPGLGKSGMLRMKSRRSIEADAAMKERSHRGKTAERPESPGLRLPSSSFSGIHYRGWLAPCPAPRRVVQRSRVDAESGRPEMRSRGSHGANDS